MVRRLREAQHGRAEEGESVLQRQTYDRNADLPTSASPRRRIGTTGASMAAFAMVVSLRDRELRVRLSLLHGGRKVATSVYCL
jgi:hypothetical protein